MGKKSSRSENGKRKTAAKTKNRSQTQNEVKDVGMWKIEGLEKKRVRKGRVEYLVKWRDFPSSENTWEPVEHLTTCPKLIQEFASRNKKKKLGRPRSGAKAKRAVVSISDDTSPSNPIVAPIPQSSTTADDDSEIENADPNPVSRGSNAVTLTYEFDWTEHPVKAVIGIDRLRATGELFYKVAWERLETDIGGGGRRIVTEWKLLPAVIVREKVPHLVIEFLRTISSWTESTPGNSPCQSPNNSVSDGPNPSADSERALSSCDHKSDNEGQGRGAQMEADSMQNIPESQINLELTLTVETHKDNEVDEKDELT